jgi:hypothetical protein
MDDRNCWQISLSESIDRKVGNDHGLRGHDLVFASPQCEVSGDFSNSPQILFAGFRQGLLWLENARDIVDKQNP